MPDFKRVEKARENDAAAVTTERTRTSDISIVVTKAMENAESKDGKELNFVNGK